MIDKSTACGRLAQLGEHHVRNVGVVGSNPMPSTRKSHLELAPTENLRSYRPFIAISQHKGSVQSREWLTAAIC